MDIFEDQVLTAARKKDRLGGTSQDYPVDFLRIGNHLFCPVHPYKKTVSNYTYEKCLAKTLYIHDPEDSDQREKSDKWDLIFVPFLSSTSYKKTVSNYEKYIAKILYIHDPEDSDQRGKSDKWDLIFVPFLSSTSCKQTVSN
ncbi:hypothetical protein RRG08_005285 [Elysia crispata]|uniref:Uncharacterized protein n=1 Tax=Elysia crispata TaxID=231223 RepID=A0AAE0YBZ4_9GAST|nr:hypothetical protein RRG08_005285 [Elysia crispata]